MNNYPSDWKISPLRNLVDIKASSVDKKSREGHDQIQLCNYMDVFNNSTINNSITFMKSTASKKEIKDFKLIKGDVLLTKDSEVPEEIGMPSVINENIDDLICGYHLYILRINNSILSPEYLCWTLRSNQIRQYFYQMANGSTRFGLNLGHVGKCLIPIPPLTKQKKIAEILSGIETTLEKSNNLIYKLKMIKNSLRINIFRKEKSSEKWQIYDLKEISDVIDSLHVTPSFSKKGFAMVRVTDIKTGDLSLTKTKKVSLEVFEKFIKKYHPKTGDIVMSRVGSYGVSSYVTTTEKFCMGQNTVVINPKDINSRYLYECLNSNFVQHQIQLKVVGSGYKSLSLADIRELKIPVAPIDEQNKFAAALKSIDDLILIQEKKITWINSLRNSLMQDLLSGRKKVNI